ncbi:MAG: AMP-dependent synthetase [Gemmatimonadetes bacterium]|nr:MAG: AMP-dependent synthetase [Gemmatimonadota bacterium]PYP07416.1 MAG: AMP-dependent synthetase [Gemmatimonadota bacterium]
MRPLTERPWLSHYDDGVPATLAPYPEKTLVDVVRETAAQRPHHTAAVFKGARLSYGRLDALSDAFAAGLAARGVVKGDRVALIMPNCPQMVIGQLGVWKAGAVAVPLNPLSSDEELAHALAATGARAGVVLTRFYVKIKRLQPGTALEVVIATNIKEFLPPVLRLAYTLLKERKEGDRIALVPGDAWFQAFIRDHRTAPPRAGPSPSDPALLLLTGGTTGIPKAALLRHHGVLMAALQLNRWFQPIIKEGEDPLACVFPPFHVAGNVGILGTALVGRNPAVLVPNPRDVDDLLRTIRKERPAVLPAVPALYNAMLAHPAVRAGKVDFSSVKLCVSGASPLLAETKRRFEQLTGARIIEVYSLTEACMAAVATPVFGTYKEGAVGIPLPDVDVRIVDAVDPSRELGPGEVGEIVIDAPQLMEGYWRDPEATQSMLRNDRLYTGDLGSLDDDGYLTIVDRKKDLIKASGFQVWPREVEEVIAMLPAVVEVGVAGVPDERQGEAVMAWVVTRSGMTVTEDEIRDHCRRHLAAYKVPKRVAFRPGLPKSAIGKVLRRELAREFRAARP